MTSSGKIVIELVSGFCNAKCVWCANSYESTASRIKKGFMGYESFNRFIDINPPTKIIPYSLGEPLLHPYFDDCMSYAGEKGWGLKSIHSNFGMYITEGALKQLIKFETITINVGGGLNETHMKNMGTDLNVVIANATRLCALKREKASKVTIKAKMLINKKNCNEVEIFKRRFNFVDLTEQFDTLFFGCSDGSEEDKLKWIENNYDGNVKIREKISIVNSEIVTRTKDNRCPGLIPTIRWNGDVNICCRVRYGDGIVGNAFETPIADIVALKEYKDAVTHAKRKEYIEYCQYCS